MTIFFKYGHFQISLDFGDGREKNFVGTDSPYVVLWKPIVPCFFCCHGSTGFHKDTVWKVYHATIHRSSVAKFQQNLKMTVLEEMVIESKLLNQI